MEIFVKHADLTSNFWEKQDKYTEISKKYMKAYSEPGKASKNLSLNVKKAIKLQEHIENK